MKVVEDHSIKNLNTFGVDVKAKYVAEIFSEDDLYKLLGNKEFENISKCVLGGGSNILFTKDYNGLIIKNSVHGIRIFEDDDEFVIIEAGAGINWDDFVNYCVERKWGGVENLSLVPGTVGAAPIQNIGNFGYRDSIFKNELINKLVITKVSLKLSKRPEINLSYPAVREELNDRKIANPKIKDLRKIIIDIRRAKLPDPKIIGNAGSFFKNPVIRIEKFQMLRVKFPDLNYYPVDNLHVKLSAATLIDKCGWKGKRIGNCGCYEKQPLVLVNYGGATADEIINLANSIKSSVEEKFEISLEKEVNLI